MLLLLIAIATPFLLILAFLLPPYLGMAGAASIIYSTSATPTSLTDHWLDIFFMIDVYQQLFTYWLANKSAVSLLTYTAPLLLLPLAGGMAAFFLGRKLIRKLSDVFHLSASV